MSDRREFLMLAHTFNIKKHGIGGWFVSEKLDGMRAFWDGGISRGLPKDEVPWANCAKDSRYVHKQVATGLWSRLGNVIHAPSWWLDKLPGVMLDGELWHGVRGDGQRQNLSRIVKPIVPGFDWKEVKFYIFDIPPTKTIFRDGRLSSPNFKKNFKDIREWKHGALLQFEPDGLYRFEKTIDRINEYCDGRIAIPHKQLRLPFQTSKANELIEEELHRVCDLQGEGLILRKPESYWEPKRVNNVLKVKKIDDAEGTVIGYISGRETDKGSKLLGMLGALILNYQGRRLELSGFTDAERALESTGFHDHPDCLASDYAAEHPGQELPDWISAVHFPRGSTVTFRYRGTSLDGIPTEARYWRKT